MALGLGTALLALSAGCRDQPGSPPEPRVEEHAWSQSPLLGTGGSGFEGASGSELGHGIPSSVHADSSAAAAGKADAASKR